MLEISPESIEREARILSLSGPNDESNDALHNGTLPMGAQLLGIGESLSDFDEFRDANPNILFVSPSCPMARVQLPLILAAFPSIEWVHVRSAGIDFVVSDEFSTFKDDCYVTNAKGQFSSSLAEYTMMACSYFAKDLPLLMKNKKNKVWDNYDIEELRGKTLGIVGLGRIGTCVARIASGFGMQVVASVGRYSSARAQELSADGITLLHTDVLLEQADIVSLNCPLIPQTRHMIDDVALAKMKPTAFLVNLSRGGVVDEDALLHALETKRILGAATDVFHTEKQDSPLMQLDNFVSTPHIGAMTSDAQMRIAKPLFADLNRALSGQPIVHRIV